MHPLSLADYLSAVKLAFDEIFYDEVWVQAELRAVNSKGGHYYFELAQKDADDNIIASCRGTLWKFKAGVVKRFESQAGTPLKAGLSVLIKGKATFHAQYGFSFNISDIDPNYTLGALAIAYNAMKSKLEQNGLLTLNKSLPMPFDLQKIAVIAPENGAGLGDFRAESDKFAKTGACQFVYYNATFQGNNAPDEIRRAIGQVLADADKDGQAIDLLVIIRGGGAVGDLAYLNDYELSAMVAECPVPVWVGIGHERDKVILDEVAHTRFDTPSKVVGAIVQFLSNRWGQARQYFETTQTHAHTALNTARHNQTMLMGQIQNLSTHLLQKEKMTLQTHLAHIQKDTRQVLIEHKNAVRHFQTVILSKNPATILEQGYAMIKKNNMVVKSVNGVASGDELTVIFGDGQIQTKVV